MKPTPEMVELARKLHDAGYRQEIQEGDWLITASGIQLVTGIGGDYLFTKRDQYLKSRMRVIPSLTDCLEWLEEYDEFYILSGIGDGTVCKTKSASETGKTREEATMLAMIKILEATDAETK